MKLPPQFDFEQQVIQNINDLGNVINTNVEVLNNRIEAILNVLETINPGAKEIYSKMMFTEQVYGLHMALHNTRQGAAGPNTLETIEEISKLLDEKKKIAKKNDWLSTLHKAERKANKDALGLKEEEKPTLKLVESGNENGNNQAGQ